MQTVGGVDQPSGNVLAHGGQDQSEEPTFAASSECLKQVKVALFAFD